jgi:hypothetical protein
MSKKILRMIGGCFLGGALAMGIARNHTISKVSSIEQDLILKNGKTTTLEFTPLLEDANYEISLEFDKSQNNFLECYAIKPFNITWQVARDSKILETGNLTNSNTGCKDTGRSAIFSFSPQNLILNRKNLIHLFIDSKNQKEFAIQTHASVVPSGISVHYTFMDLALQEIIFLSLLIISLGCFLPDIFSLLQKPWKT